MYDIIVVIFMVKAHPGGCNIDITNASLADQYAHPLADWLIDFSQQ